MKLQFSKEPRHLAGGTAPGPKRHFGRLGAALLASAALMLPFGCANKAGKEPERKAEVRIVHLSKPLRSLILDAMRHEPRRCDGLTFEEYDQWSGSGEGGAEEYAVSAKASTLRVKTKNELTGRTTSEGVKLGRDFTAFISFAMGPDGHLSTTNSLTYRDSIYRSIDGSSSNLQPGLYTKVVPLDTFNAILARATGERSKCTWPMRLIWVLDHDARGDCNETSAFAISVRDSVVEDGSLEGSSLLLNRVEAGKKGNDGNPIPFKIQGLYKGGYLACGWGDPSGPRWDAVVFLVEPGVPVPDLKELGVKTVSFYSNARERDAAYQSNLAAERAQNEMRMRMSRSAGGPWKN